MCGTGHQKSLATPRAFEGGQTPLYKTLPKIGFHNHNALDFQIVNLDKLQLFVDMGRLVLSDKQSLTARDLLKCGLVTQVRDGIKLLAKVRLVGYQMISGPRACMPAPIPCQFY
jgi:ribosomal protein L15